MFSRRNAKKKSVQRNATARSESSTPNETFFPAVCDSFAFCLLFLRSLLAAILFFFCLPFAFPVVFSVGGRFATNTRIHAGNGEIHGSCNSFSLAVFFSSFSISFSPLNFRFLIFFSSLFFCLCVFILQHVAGWCYNADLKQMFCIFVMCVFRFYVFFSGGFGGTFLCDENFFAMNIYLCFLFLLSCGTIYLFSLDFYPCRDFCASNIFSS